MDQAEAERKISILEEQYDELREDVECELESAWVNAGFFPPDIPSYPTSSKAPGTQSTRPAIPSTASPHTTPFFKDLNSTPNQHLKRKYNPYSPVSPTFSPFYASKMPKIQHTPEPIVISYSDDSTDSEGLFPSPINPIGLRTCMIPLTPKERQKMVAFNWLKAGKGKVGVRSRKVLLEDCVSPMGTKWKY
jgi:hypothetical protein